MLIKQKASMQMFSQGVRSGKQLTSYSKGSTSVSFAYNEDGLRLCKVVDGTNTEYYLSEKVDYLS